MSYKSFCAIALVGLVALAVGCAKENPKGLLSLSVCDDATDEPGFPDLYAVIVNSHDAPLTVYDVGGRFCGHVTISSGDKVIGLIDKVWDTLLGSAFIDYNKRVLRPGESMVYRLKLEESFVVGGYPVSSTDWKQWVMEQPSLTVKCGQLVGMGRMESNTVVIDNHQVPKEGGNGSASK